MNTNFLEKAPIAIALDYPLFVRGGVGVIVESLLKNLSPELRVVLVSPDDPENLKAYCFYSRISEHIKFSQSELTRTTAKNLSDSIAKRKIKLIHFHGGGNYAWGCRQGFKSPFPFLARANIRTIFSAHQVNPLHLAYYPSERRYWYKLALLPVILMAGTYALGHATQIITDSKHDAVLLNRQYPLLAKKISFIYHSRLDVANKYSDTNHLRQKNILSVGHVARRKGQHILAAAFAKIASRFPDWNLTIAGPLDESECVNIIKRIRLSFGLEARIQILGSHQTPHLLMERTGIFVQPSFMEAFGLALQEAMFLGCACVGSNTGGIPELITDNRTGRLVTPGNADHLAKVLTELILAPEKRQEFGEAARVEVVRKGMTGRAMAENYEKIYQQALRQ